MEIFRITRNAWGQETLEGISWDLLPVAFWLGVAFIVGSSHLARAAQEARRRAGTGPFLNMSHQQSPATAGNRDGDSPHRREGDSPLITRHAPIDRVFHWITALAVLLLLGSAFLPILGLKFSWVPLHWITGLVLTVAVLFHLVRSSLLPAPALHV